ncbi:hypothetical protein IWW36_001266 [Coemansia brasiliensis]|uniref:Pentatricopeptide repeat-containing protein n=1 Tax=Coemansia brasiliensis TaxID=2650707 RepID=A0A9W8II41_9FUNG|nr:hypothetical protein IWW36_001266 [Coemansia brasiliensis]
MLYWASRRCLRQQVPRLAYRPLVPRAKPIPCDCMNFNRQHACVSDQVLLQFGSIIYLRFLTVDTRKALSQHAGPSNRTKDIEGIRQHEEQLVNEIQLLTRSGSFAQREVCWGLYKRGVELGIGSHLLDSSTIISLISSVASDKDMNRSLKRIVEILNDITSMRELTDNEIDHIRLIWEHFEATKDTSVVWKPQHNEACLAIAGSPNNKKELAKAVNAPDIPINSASMDVNTTRDPSKRAQAVTRLRYLFNCAPIFVDPVKLWETYRWARSTGAETDYDALTREDMAQLIKCCADLGKITGQRFLMRIEIDLSTSTYPAPDLYGWLMVSYAKLGLFEHSQRIYDKASTSSKYKDEAYYAKLIDWGFCRALFSASRQIEGRQIFDNLVAARQATPRMYYFLIKEYVLMRNVEQAFALFDEIYRKSMLVNQKTFNMLAVACGLDKNSKRANERLAAIIACMRSWHISPDTMFFISLLKGYSRSGQQHMFDGLATRLRLHQTSSNIEFDKVVMVNAAQCNNKELALAMGELVAQDPNSIPKVVSTLCDLGQASFAKKLALLSKYPSNNITANLQLEMCISDPSIVAEVGKLQDQVADMLKHGFTPSFRLTKDLIGKIWFHEGRDAAIRTYKMLTASGAPISVSLLLLMLQIYAQASLPHDLISVFAELRGRLSRSDFGIFQVPEPVIRKLIDTLIEYQGIEAAQSAFDFLSSLSILPARLPFTSMIRYYINFCIYDKLQALLGRIVQHNIPISAQGINLCCNYIAENMTVGDLANFLRYLERANRLNRVSDDVLASFFAMGIHEYKMADIRWAVGALIRLNRNDITWKTIIDRLAVINNKDSLSRFVKVAMKKGPMLEVARKLVSSARASAWGAIVGDAVITILRQSKFSVDIRIYQAVFSKVLSTWDSMQSLKMTDARSKITVMSLAEILERNIGAAIAAGIYPPLAASSLLIISSSSSYAYLRCLNIIRGINTQTHCVSFYGAIARGCARFGSVEGADRIMQEMQEQSIRPNVRILNTVMSCYANSSPQSMSYLEQVVTRPDQLDLVTKREIVDDISTPDAVSLDPSKALAFGNARVKIQESSLAKVMSVWHRFKQLDLTPNHETYAIMLQALTNARKYKICDDLLKKMAYENRSHNADTAYAWIRLCLIRGDIKTALEIFNSIGDRAFCKQLTASDSRYRGLELVTLVPKHFAIFIHRYLANAEYEAAMRMFVKMHQENLKGQPWLYSLLLNTLANADRRDLFIQVMKQMVASNVAITDEVMQVVRRYLSNKHQGITKDPRQIW